MRALIISEAFAGWRGRNGRTTSGPDLAGGRPGAQLNKSRA